MPVLAVNESTKDNEKAPHGWGWMTRAGLEPATKGLRVPCSAKLS